MQDVRGAPFARLLNSRKTERAAIGSSSGCTVCGAPFALAWGGLLLALLAAYSNHFGNGFHFDDAHAVVENPAIRTLENVPRFFTDARTFSHDPAAQTYRPLVTASLALDDWLGKGLNPYWFHISTFFWYVIQLLLMYRLYLYVLE